MRGGRFRYNRALSTTFLGMKLMAHSNLRALAVAGVRFWFPPAPSPFAATKDDEAANKRIAPVARVEIAAPAAGAAAGSRSGEQIYKAVCGACHDSGVAGAPKVGDKAAWAPRIKPASTA
jgi:mono/diheme cytochrome c family protein